MASPELDFDGALSRLQEWLGQRVAVEVLDASTGYEPLNVVGDLSADLTMTDPVDEEAFDFAIGNSGALSISRARFMYAWADERELHIETGREGLLEVVVKLMD